MTDENKDMVCIHPKEEKLTLSMTLINSNSSPSRMLMHVPYEGDMNYLYLSPLQARYLLDELEQSLKNANDADILVLPFPKEPKNDL